MCTFFHLVRMVNLLRHRNKRPPLLPPLLLRLFFFTLTLHIKDFFFIFPKFFIKILFVVILFINYFCVTFLYQCIFMFIYLFQLLLLLNQYHFFFFHFYLSFSLVCLFFNIHIFNIIFFFLEIYVLINWTFH